MKLQGTVSVPHREGAPLWHTKKRCRGKNNKQINCFWNRSCCVHRMILLPSLELSVPATSFIARSRILFLMWGDEAQRLTVFLGLKKQLCKIAVSLTSSCHADAEVHAETVFFLNTILCFWSLVRTLCRLRTENCMFLCFLDKHNFIVNLSNILSQSTFLCPVAVFSVGLKDHVTHREY